MKILVVEPHADDAFLSLGAHIEFWVKRGDDVTIATVYSATPKRGAEACAYANAVGAEWIALGAKEVRPRREDHPELIDVTWKFTELVEEGQYNQIISPIGIRHPEHRAVRDLLNRGLFNHILYYWEQPYSVVSTNRDELAAKAFGRKIVSYMKPNMRKWRHIPIFKTQAKFFHFNPAESLNRTFEMIVGDK